MMPSPRSRGAHPGVITSGAGAKSGKGSKVVELADWRKKGIWHGTDGADHTLLWTQSQILTLPLVITLADILLSCAWNLACLKPAMIRIM
jgi:hypothetical protein